MRRMQTITVITLLTLAAGCRSRTAPAPPSGSGDTVVSANAPIRSPDGETDALREPWDAVIQKAIQQADPMVQLIKLDARIGYYRDALDLVDRTEHEVMMGTDMGFVRFPGREELSWQLRCLSEARERLHNELRMLVEDRDYCRAQLIATGAWNGLRSPHEDVAGLHVTDRETRKETQ